MADNRHSTGPFPTPETRAAEVLRRALGRAGRELGKAVLLAALCAGLGIGVNALRGKERGGIDLVARAPYDLYADCPEMESNLPRLSVAALRRGRAHVVLLDARPAPRYLAGHLPGARSLPMYGTRPNAPGGLGWLKAKRGRFVVVYGQDEMQSALHLASFLKQNGVRGVHLLEGDLAAWKKAKLPLVTRAVPSITVAAAREAKDVLFLDARPAAAFAEGHVPGARSVPFNGLVPPRTADFAPLLAEKRRLVVYGVEAVDDELADPDKPATPKDVGRLLAAELAALGAARVAWLPGDLEAWRTAGGPVERAAAGAAQGAP